MPKPLRVVLIELRSDDGLQTITAACLRAYALADEALAAAVRIDILRAVLDNGRCGLTAQQVASLEPDLVGFPCYLWTIREAHRIARELKALRPETRVVFGGPEVTGRGEEVLARYPETDFAAVGDEGEETFRRLLRHMSLGDEPLERVPGLARRAQDGRVEISAPAELIDIAAAPSAILGSPLEGKGCCLLEASRGCPFDCKFCDWGLRKMRYVPLERLRAEFRYLAPRVCRISLCDADPLMSERRGIELVELFLDAARGSDCWLGFNTNPTFVTPAIVDAMAAAPQKFGMALGIQSVNPKVLKTIDRLFDREKVEANLRYLREKVPEMRLTLQLIYGLPGDTYDSFMDSVDWALSMAPPHQLQLFRALVLPGAELKNMAQSHGVRYDSEPPYFVMSTASMSAQELRLIARFAFYHAFFFWVSPMSGSFIKAWDRISRPEETRGRRRVEVLRTFVDGIERGAELPPYEHEKSWESAFGRMANDGLLMASIERALDKALSSPAVR